MHTDNLLELLPPELIPFILKYLPEQDLENSCSINDIWKNEAKIEWHKRLKFILGLIIQGNYTVKEYYSKLKECNLSNDYPEEILKVIFLGGLSSENKIKVLMDGLQAVALDEIVERLSPEVQSSASIWMETDPFLPDQSTNSYGEAERKWSRIKALIQSSDLPAPLGPIRLG